MDIPLLLSWLSARQYAPEGGFSGRTNKLVDGCYSHWVGDCWPLVQSALYDTPESDSVPALENDLFSREGLARYILNCCQNKTGGLRDKPGKYVLTAHSPIIQPKRGKALIVLTPADAPTRIIPATHSPG